MKNILVRSRFELMFFFLRIFINLSSDDFTLYNGTYLKSNRMNTKIYVTSYMMNNDIKKICILQRDLDSRISMKVNQPFLYKIRFVTQ